MSLKDIWLKGELVATEYYERFEPTGRVFSQSDFNSTSFINYYSDLYLLRCRTLDKFFELEGKVNKTAVVKIFKNVRKLQAEFWTLLEREMPPSLILTEMNRLVVYYSDQKMQLLYTESILPQFTSLILNLIASEGGSNKKFNNLIVENLRRQNHPHIEGLKNEIESFLKDVQNVHSAYYNQLTGSDLPSDWLMYRNSNLANTRPFCLAMSAKKFFHLSEIGCLLMPDYLSYTVDGSPVRTGLTHEEGGVFKGQFPGIKASDFLIVRGGKGCGHSIATISESFVKMQNKVLFDQVAQTENFQCWTEA